MVTIGVAYLNVSIIGVDSGGAHRTKRYRPVSFRSRKQIGIVNTRLEISSTVRDLPMPELCTIGRMISLDSESSTNARAMERSSCWLDPTKLVNQAFSIAENKSKGRFQHKGLVITFPYR